MAEIKVPIQVNLPDDWVEQIVNRLRNDPDAEWVEIIRCRDCKYRGVGDYCVYGTRLAWVTKSNDFCSKAERRTDEE